MACVVFLVHWFGKRSCLRETPGGISAPGSSGGAGRGGGGCYVSVFFQLRVDCAFDRAVSWPHLSTIGYK